MRKKISKLDLAGLRKNFTVLCESEMKTKIGGKDDYSKENWFTYEEVENWKGSWPGGWVYDFGYIPSDNEAEELSLCISNDNNDLTTFMYTYGGYGNIYETENGSYKTDYFYGFDLGKTLAYLAQNAESKSTGYCAKYIREALEAGGFNTSGHPSSAHEYDTYLKKMGFVEVDKKNYVPQPGDIVVHEAIPGHSDGHISMYDGSNWYSDFKQKDMHGGSAFRNSDNYTILRIP